jgi:peptidoglycan/xylan/chitin deacetylase (PgdA/CDA1 family)
MNQNNGFVWPDKAKCAVSLTYDDGLLSQFEHALPQLDRYGIKGTFFPSNAGLTDPANAPIWKKAVAFGHEIGCHTLYHPCGNTFDFVKKGYSLQEYTLDRMEREIMDNIAVIRGFGYKDKELVFAYPCGQTAVGPKLDISYRPLIQKIFMAGRGIMSAYADPGDVYIHEVPCFGVELDGQGLIELVKEAERKQSWAVILFHGISGDYIQVTAKAHEQLLRYLKGNKDIWTGRFGDTAKYIIEKKAVL